MSGKKIKISSIISLAFFSLPFTDSPVQSTKQPIKLDEAEIETRQRYVHYKEGNPLEARLVFSSTEETTIVLRVQQRAPNTAFSHQAYIPAFLERIKMSLGMAEAQTREKCSLYFETGHAEAELAFRIAEKRASVLRSQLVTFLAPH